MNKKVTDRVLTTLTTMLLAEATATRKPKSEVIFDNLVEHMLPDEVCDLITAHPRPKLVEAVSPEWQRKVDNLHLKIHELEEETSRIQRAEYGHKQYLSSKGQRGRFNRLLDRDPECGAQRISEIGREILAIQGQLRYIGAPLHGHRVGNRAANGSN